MSPRSGANGVEDRVPNNESDRSAPVGEDLYPIIAPVVAAPHQYIQFRHFTISTSKVTPASGQAIVTISVSSESVIISWLPLSQLLSAYHQRP